MSTVPNLQQARNYDVITGGAFGSIIGREPDEYVGFYGEMGTPQQPAAGSGVSVIDLGVAVTYGGGASSTITNTGTTNITGDLFLSPAGSITGSPTVSGTIHNGDAAAAAALLAAGNAFTAGNALPGYVTTGAALGGTSPPPGYYTTGSSFNITGTLTLSGGPNDVWIFKSPSSTLVTASASSVVLTGGAQAKNVFWLVGSSATLGTGSTFVGTVIAQASITDNGGSTVNGHLFALTAAVTFNNTTVIATGSSGGGVGLPTTVAGLVTVLQNLGLLSLPVPLFFMTGTITSGTFSNGELLVQAYGGAEATLQHVSADTQTLNVSGITGKNPPNLTVWTGKTSGATFLPSSQPISTAMLVL